MIKRKNILKIAIDSPAAAGAGTLARAISKHYNLFYLDTGKIYRMIAYLKIKFPKKFNQNFIKSKIKTLKLKDLEKKITIKNYLKDHRVFMASVIAALSFGGKWTIHDKDSIKTSFPSFLKTINKFSYIKYD